jgi:hypothetical protein
LWLKNKCECLSDFKGNGPVVGRYADKHLSRLSTYPKNSLIVYESRGRVISVKSVGKLESEVALESTGEGRTWRGARRFRLSQDGRTLTDVTMDKYHFARVRCETAQKRH